MSNKWQLLKKEDEEFQMLLEVCEEYARQKSDDTPQTKSGNATEIVIRNHLLERGLNVTLNSNVRIQGSNIRNDMVLLKPDVNPDKLIYVHNKADVVLEIKNNAVGDQSTGIKRNFDELRKISENLRFAVVVLSERKGYTYAITEKNLENEQYRVFTLVSRKKYPKGGLYRKAAIIEMLEKEEMKRTGDWDRLLKYLRQKSKSKLKR